MTVHVLTVAWEGRSSKQQIIGAFHSYDDAFQRAKEVLVDGYDTSDRDIDSFEFTITPHSRRTEVKETRDGWGAAYQDICYIEQVEVL